MENIDGDFIVRAMLVLAPLDREQKEQVLRRAVHALGTYQRAPFRGEDARSQEFLKGGKPGADMVVMLRHPFLDERSSDDNGWTKLSVTDDGRNQPSYLFVSINVGREDQIALQWRVGLELAPRLVTGVLPSAGFMNGKLIDDEHYVALPAPATFIRPGPPEAITPWTYIAASRLQDDDAERRWRSLPAARLESLAEGLVIQVVERLQDPPPPAFVDALAQLRKPRVRYIAPQLSTE